MRSAARSAHDAKDETAGFSICKVFDMTKEDVEEFLGWLEMGPAGARVDRVDVRRAEVEGHPGFEIR